MGADAEGLLEEPGPDHLVDEAGGPGGEEQEAKERGRGTGRGVHRPRLHPHGVQLQRTSHSRNKAWNRPTGRAALDELVWFRYVETEGLPG